MASGRGCVLIDHDTRALHEPVLLRAAVKVGKPYTTGEIGRTIRCLPGPGLEAEGTATTRRGITMDETWQRKVRERAHAVWEREGCPEGWAERHWAQAEEELRSEGQGEASPTDASPSDGDAAARDAVGGPEIPSA